MSEEEYSEDVYDLIRSSWCPLCESEHEPCEDPLDNLDDDDFFIGLGLRKIAEQ